MVLRPKRTYAVLAAIASLGVAGCMQNEAPGRDTWSNAPPARVTGPPVNCIPLTAINESRVRDDRTIDFMRSSRQGWRNTLPYSCPGLAVQNAFTHKTSTSELCSVDVIYVLETTGGLHRGAGCGLGQFVPIELER
jgi:hypothetical protein